MLSQRSSVKTAATIIPAALFALLLLSRTNAGLTVARMVGDFVGAADGAGDGRQQLPLAAMASQARSSKAEATPRERSARATYRLPMPPVGTSWPRILSRRGTIDSVPTGRP